MAVTHLFPTKPPRNDVGQQIVAPAGQSLSFRIEDFLPNLTNGPLPANVNWDFGDGTLAQTTTASPAAKTYNVPGIYTVIAQVLIGESVQTATWHVRVVPDRGMIATTVTEPFVAAIHDTFRDDATGRIEHAVVLLPVLTGVQTGVGPGTWGTPDTLAITDSGLAQAVDDAASRLQAAYASGFGRMPMPQARLEQAVFAEFALDSVAVGTSDELAKYMTVLELAWRQSGQGADDGPGGTFMAAAAKDVTDNVASYASILSLSWSPQTQLGGGLNSVRAADIMRWLEYIGAEVDDSTVETSLKVARARRFARMYADEVPTFDPDTAWAWEVAQAAMQAVYSFYASLDIGGTVPGANMRSATILVLGNPATGRVTVRLVDATTKLWAVWQVGPAAAADDAPALSDLNAIASRRGGDFVGVRGVAVAGTGGGVAPQPWNVRRVEALLTPSMRAQTPGFGLSFSGDNLVTLAAQPNSVLQTMTTAFVQDGTVRRYAAPTGANAVVADVVRPAIPLTSFDRMRGGLRPHAAWHVYHGRNTPGIALAKGAEVSGQTLANDQVLGMLQARSPATWQATAEFLKAFIK